MGIYRTNQRKRNHWNKHIRGTKNMFVAVRFLSKIVEKYDEHPVSTDRDTWYPQACQFLKLNHHLHFLYMRMRKHY
jgi:putative transposase